MAATRLIPMQVIKGKTPLSSVSELEGSVKNFTAFFDALMAESPVPIGFEEIPGGAKGYFSLIDNRIAIKSGMSEAQTVKTAIHEIAHARLHAVDPKDKDAPDRKVSVRASLNVRKAEAVAKAPAKHKHHRTEERAL